jgi:hypothetical protein
MITTTGRVHTGTRQAISLHRRNTAECETGMTEISVTSFVAEMHMTGSKTGVRSTRVLNRSYVQKGTMITMDPITTNLTDSILPKEGVMQEESRHSLKT